MSNDTNSQSTPDFSTEIVGGFVVEKKGVKIQWYKGVEELCISRNLDPQVLTKAKQNKFPGFKSNGRVNWNEARQYLQDNYQRLLQEVVSESASKYSHITDEREMLELRKLKADVIAKENANRREERDYIKRKPVIETSRQIYGKIMSEILRVFVNEAPTKQDRKPKQEIESMNKKYAVQLLQDLQHKIAYWEAGKDMDES